MIQQNLTKPHIDDKITIDEKITIDHVINVKKLKIGNIMSNVQYLIMNEESGYIQVNTLQGSNFVSLCLLNYGNYKTSTQYCHMHISLSKLIVLIRDEMKWHKCLIEFKNKNNISCIMTCYLKSNTGIFGRSIVLKLIEKKHNLKEKQRIEHHAIARLEFNEIKYISTNIK